MNYLRFLNRSADWGCPVGWQSGAESVVHLWVRRDFARLLQTELFARAELPLLMVSQVVPCLQWRNIAASAAEVTVEHGVDGQLLSKLNQKARSAVLESDSSNLALLIGD